MNIRLGFFLFRIEIHIISLCKYMQTNFNRIIVFPRSCLIWIVKILCYMCCVCPVPDPSRSPPDIGCVPIQGLHLKTECVVAPQLGCSIFNGYTFRTSTTNASFHSHATKDPTGGSFSEPTVPRIHCAPVTKLMADELRCGCSKWLVMQW